jgi:hypothetical protein
MNWFIYLFHVPFSSFYGPGNNGIRLRLWTLDKEDWHCPVTFFQRISINNTTNIPSGFHFQNQKSGIFKDFIRVCVFAGKSV